MRAGLLLSVVLGIYALASAHAQRTPSLAYPTQQVTLGQSLVPLTGPWKFHAGDNPQWAEPNFDDSQWETLTLPGKPETNAGAPFSPIGFFPGWGGHGHPHYAGYGWYRIRVQLDHPVPDLALMLGLVESSYEVYLNGQRIGGFGNVAWRVMDYYPTPQVFAIPGLKTGPDSDMVLALRVSAPIIFAYPEYPAFLGGLMQTPVLGERRPLVNRRQAWIDQSLVQQISSVPVDVLLLLVGMVALVLFFVSQRKQREYLWIAVCVLSLWCYDVTLWIELHTTIVSINITGLLIDFLIAPIIYGGLLGQLYLLDIGENRRLRWASASVGFLALGLTCLYTPRYSFGWLASDHWSWISGATRILYPALYLLVGIVLLAMVWVGLRRQPGRETWISLGPGIAFAWFYVAIFFQQWSFALKHHWPTTDIKLFFEYTIPLAVGTVLLRRFILQQKDRDLMQAELQEAQLVQQVLIPEELPKIAGLTIESEYRPAREVGGDFFQILPDDRDGSVLIVVGDVTGKGLQAGMLVALIVGSVRTAIETSFDPLHVLESLNRRLSGRGHAHATCLALRVTAEGAVTLANAGHLPPYLNGEEVPMEGALPLGMVPGAEFSLLEFRLKEGDRLLLMSDGVAEAQDKRGQLFGFERIHAMLQKPITAAEIASAAQTFGQEDDISVLSITRLAEAIPQQVAPHVMAVS